MPLKKNLIFFFAILMACITAGCLNQVMHPFPRNTSFTIMGDSVNMEYKSYWDRVVYFLATPAIRYSWKPHNVEVSKTSYPGILSLFNTTEIKSSHGLTDEINGGGYMLLGSVSDSHAKITIMEQGRGGKAAGHLEMEKYGIFTGSFKGKKITIMSESSAASYDRKTEGGKTMWHQYPAGGLIRVFEEETLIAEMMEGSEPGSCLSLPTWKGPKFIVSFRKGLSREQYCDAVMLLITHRTLRQLNSECEKEDD